MIKYDNCKDCISNCEHAGKNREFVCPHGISCKKTIDEKAQEKAAEKFCKAISTIAEKPENMDNLQCYLSHHFETWLKRFANDPESIAAELTHFAEMEI